MNITHKDMLRFSKELDRVGCNMMEDCKSGPIRERGDTYTHLAELINRVFADPTPPDAERDDGRLLNCVVAGCPNHAKKYYFACAEHLDAQPEQPAPIPKPYDVDWDRCETHGIVFIKKGTCVACDAYTRGYEEGAKHGGSDHISKKALREYLELSSKYDSSVLAQSIIDNFCND